MKFVPLFAWFDFWVGIFWDAKKRRIYVFPIPVFGFYVQLKTPEEDLPEYAILVVGDVHGLKRAVNAAIAKGYKPLGPPFAEMVKPDPFAQAYYQWAQAVVKK